MPLSRIKRDSEGVIEMSVRDEDVRHADRHVGTASDVEHRAELADAEIRLVSGARASFDREVLGGDREEIFVGHPFTIRAPWRRKSSRPPRIWRPLLRRGSNY